MTPPTPVEALAAIEPQGHGLPDHCSEHGDIPRTMSIVQHIEQEHGLTYEQFETLREADAIRRRTPAERALDKALHDAEMDGELSASGISTRLAASGWQIVPITKADEDE